MKFLTKDIYDSWYGRHEDDRPLDAACKAYRDYLATMAPAWPERIRALAELRGVDDGLVVEVHHIRSLNRLILVLRCGDLQMGYYDLVLSYDGAEISPEHELTLAQIARSDSEVFEQELEVAEDGRIVHRLMFHPGDWFAISCRELDWTSISRPNREIPRLGDRFPGGPTTLRKKRLRSAPPRG